MTLHSGGFSAHLERIMLGEEQAGPLRIPLGAARGIYSAGLYLKNRIYDAGLATPFRSPCLVISVGGLTLGGAGKTPLAIHIARLISANKKVGILTRGYGQQADVDVLVVSDGAKLCQPPPYSADEAYMMADKLPGVPVVTAPRRAAGATLLVNRFGVEVIVLDDGFSHRAIHRDVDIVLVDKHALDPARRKLFPLGYLREPPENLDRATMAVVMIRYRDEESLIGEYTEEIRRLAGKEIPVAYARGAITGFVTPSGKSVDSIPGPVLAFCGIARPGGFQRSLEERGVAVEALLPFSDHHPYTRDDMTLIHHEALRVGAAGLVTTEKDLARLAAFVGMDELAGRLYIAQWDLELKRFEEAWIEP
ncbi:MAG: tetraacyldisaccharide 4'-kinase [Nitrospinota bacterium]|nr:tetraacyldisaccharide 4'-kinase [Nitrospinota bacterium]